MVDLVNDQRPDVRAQYDRAAEQGERIVTCAIAAHELVFGAMISRRPSVHTKAVEAFLSAVEIAEWSHADGLATAQIRTMLRRRGTSIGGYDALIAGQALARGWRLVSANLHEFLRVDGLDVLDWRNEPA